MEFLKKLGASLFERVFVHYKPTFVGVGAAAAIVVIDEFTTLLQSLPDGWAKAAAGVAVVVGALVKQKLTEKVQE